MRTDDVLFETKDVTGDTVQLVESDTTDRILIRVQDSSRDDEGEYPEDWSRASFDPADLKAFAEKMILLADAKINLAAWAGAKIAGSPVSISVPAVTPDAPVSRSQPAATPITPGALTLAPKAKFETIGVLLGNRTVAEIAADLDRINKMVDHPIELSVYQCSDGDLMITDGARYSDPVLASTGRQIVVFLVRDSDGRARAAWWEVMHPDDVGRILTTPSATPNTHLGAYYHETGRPISLVLAGMSFARPEHYRVGGDGSLDVFDNYGDWQIVTNGLWVVRRTAEREASADDYTGMLVLSEADYKAAYCG